MLGVENNPVRAKRAAFNKITEGFEIDNDVRHFNSPTLENWRLKGQVDRVYDGGFYGRVLSLRGSDKVIKLAQPDPWHEFWRLVNWRRPFPPQTSEVAAQQDHLATQIIHRLLPYVTKGYVSSPASFGYTFFDKVGYGQVLERMQGRHPRFDLGTDEVSQIRQAQQSVLELGTEFGLDQIGQVHPDNPFAFANLWLDGKGGVIWLDPLPAFRHTTYVAPFFRFGFHKDVIRRMDSTDPTFNRIHTDRFRQALKTHRPSFPTEGVHALEEDLKTYDTITGRMEEGKDKKAFITASLECGLITQSQAEELLHSPVKYALYVASLGVEPLAEVATSLIMNRTPVKFITDSQFRSDALSSMRKIVTDPQFREEFMENKFTFAGVNEAYQRGFITEDELSRIKQAATENGGKVGQSKKALVYANLQASYVLASQLLNAIEASSYLSAFFVDNPIAAVATGFFAGWVVPSIVRPTLTYSAQYLTGVSLERAAKVSILPKLGSYLAVPAEMAYSASGESAEVWHYTLRNVVARFSKLLRPWGGWGTQFEAELWERVSPLSNIVFR